MRLGPVVHFASLFTATLSTGVFFGTLTSLGPATGSFSPRTYIEVQQATVRNLRPVMGPLLPAAVAANLAMAVVRRRQGSSRASRLTVVGFTGQLTALAITVAVELPINARLLTWSSENPPEGWEGVRNRWAMAHRARVAAAVLGLGSLLAASVSESAPR
ncbi:anthrone oxygenase family protein [Curtobacterium sp. MCBD17_040]|uniref:anthrone oxygenase family protein n=1 Tax=Curtobacterium sp. MCBD17_040 TaxID=2175674 RepID=UPI000DA93A96|nr:anthrone oxygenase family protein [Curtobacterium sp. MCBD17_040]WIB63576.1 DUF1772 domain-containing protein [Curtobacterium sp. MCBD17_040]